jgi:predicted nucleic acid-binding protein
MGANGSRPGRLTLDAGALIGLERRDQRVVTLLEEQAASGGRVALPATALAQAWRDGRRQVGLARLVASPDTEIPPLDAWDSRAVGALLATSGTSDVADAHVVLCALRAGGPVATSDPDDLRRLAPSLPIVEV